MKKKSNIAHGRPLNFLETFFHRRLLKSPSRKPSSLQKRIDSKIALSLSEWVENEGYCSSEDGLEEVALGIGISKEQLAYYFRTRVGVPFTRWRVELRIRKAKRLLVSCPRMSVKAVGEAVGMPDKSNFRKIFRLQTGFTPSEWRERHSRRIGF